jgi:hypothetical protein
MSSQDKQRENLTNAVVIDEIEQIEGKHGCVRPKKPP